MRKDTVFRAKLKRVPKFEFNQKVAEVFDDMVSRSVPFYHEIHRLLIDILNYRLKDEDRVYDLGCSTGSTLALVHAFAVQKGIKNVKLIGIDSSPSMVQKASEKLRGLNVPAQLICNKAEEEEFEKCGVIIMNYTLQFIPAKERKALIKKAYKALRPGGILILSEKIKSSTPAIPSLITDTYYDFKRRNGYSELEISQKREALENVLVPWTPEKQAELLKSAGFNKSEMLFRWYNFASFVGVK